jgi:general secretion pathway protein G
MNNRDMNRGAFSIVELVLVVIVIGIVAALAIPKFSAAAVNHDRVNLKTDLAVLRTAIEMYYHDHQAYPGQQDAGSDAAAGSAAAVVLQLTRYTDAAGRVGEMRNEEFRFGPYLRDGIPPCPVSVGRPSAEIHLISGDALPAFDASAASAGWVFNFQTGYVAANSPGVDESGTRYDSY